jgi:hypothetical protein
MRPVSVTCDDTRTKTFQGKHLMKLNLRVRKSANVRVNCRFTRALADLRARKHTFKFSNKRVNFC